MKTLRCLGMVLLTIVMSVNLSSCGDDDKEEDIPSAPDNNVSKKKQISSILLEYGIEYSHNMKFYYDSHMRLQRVTTFELEGKDCIEEGEYNINYSANGLDFKITFTDNYTVNSHVVLNSKGSVKSFQCTYFDSYDRGTSDCDFTYDDGGFLESVFCVYDDGESTKDTYIWNGDNLIRILSQSGLKKSIEYTQIPNDYNLDLNWLLLFDCMDSYLNDEESFWLTGLLRKQGVSCTNMLKMCDDVSFSYNLDKDGYIKKITMNNGESYTITYK